jgi:hypothetical protein
LRLCWIDTYLGLPDNIIYDTSKNFVLAEFREQAKSLVIETKEIPIKAYYLVSKVERYYNPLRQAYKIISKELRGTNTSNKMKLQIVVKAINDSIGLDNIIPILLVFGAYLRITNNSLLLLITIKRTKVIRKASNKIRKFYTKRYINDTLRIRNSPNITEILQFLI